MGRQNPAGARHTICQRGMTWKTRGPARRCCNRGRTCEALRQRAVVGLVCEDHPMIKPIEKVRRWLTRDPGNPVMLEIPQSQAEGSVEPKKPPRRERPWLA